jgi:tetratricopeptide (TPR) repeat protein
MPNRIPLNTSLKALDKAIELNPNDALAYFHRGKIYQEQGLHDLAVKDYKKAGELEPELIPEIEMYAHNKLNSGDHLKKIPDAALKEEAPSLLDAKDFNQLSQTNRYNSQLFKSALTLKKLLNLIVRLELEEKIISELDKKEVADAIIEGGHPILDEVDKILKQDSSIALKRDHITDRSGRNFYWSPLEAAHWI